MQLSNQLLIAMPGLTDPEYSQTVTYICEHNAQGSMGLVLNKPTHFRLSELFKHLNMACPTSSLSNKLLLSGGPMQREHGFILHENAGEWESSMAVTSTTALTSSRDILQAITQGKGPTNSLIALGYAGWGPGQLEQELSDNAWLTAEATAEILFDTPTDILWQTSAHLIGVDITRLSSEAGHA